ncbi:MAG: CinA family protein [Alphaproteobacteria bacterium]|nr:CinA family protein [Alphaproteobacteria bacterium]
MFSQTLLTLAQQVLDRARNEGLHVALAESCTGGLITALLTEIPGSSDVVERGFVVYSNEAKAELLGVPLSLIQENGAVSEAVARAMAAGALKHSRAEIAVAVTGIAGPGGGGASKPIGLVHIATARDGTGVRHEVHRFGNIGRTAVRLKTVEAALQLVLAQIP